MPSGGGGHIIKAVNLFNQPTLRPTRKMAAVGWTSLLVPIVAAIIAPWLPGLSEACGGEVGAYLVADGPALAQGAVNFVAGYVVKERVSGWASSRGLSGSTRP